MLPILRRYSSRPVLRQLPAGLVFATAEHAHHEIQLLLFVRGGRPNSRMGFAVLEMPVAGQSGVQRTLSARFRDDLQRRRFVLFAKKKPKKPKEETTPPPATTPITFDNSRFSSVPQTSTSALKIRPSVPTALAKTPSATIGVFAIRATKWTTRVKRAKTSTSAIWKTRCATADSVATHLEVSR